MIKIIKEFKNRYYFLSNFYPVKIIIDGLEYPTTEHYFQSMKFLDPKIQKKIRNTPTPSLAKKLSPNVQLIDDGELFNL